MKTVKKTFCLFFAIFMICCCFPLSTNAATFSPMDSSYVVTDLKNMLYDVNQYPVDTSAKFVSVIDFFEFGYSALEDYRYFGLYIYLYNPTGVEILEKDSYLQMAYKLGDGSTTKYVKYPLDIVSVSIDAHDKNLFYKFKVQGTSSLVRTIDIGSRTYMLSGIELNHVGNGVTDFDLSQTWTYTGYQENFGESVNKEGLQCYKDVFETIQTELRPASWFSATSDLGENFRYEISSVYFYIPDYFINEYGNPGGDETSGLYSVSGTYDKYVTNGLLVPDETWYDRFDGFVGKDFNTVSGPWQAVGFFEKDTSGLDFWENHYYYLYTSFNMKLGEYIIRSDYGTSTKYTVESSFDIKKLCNLAIAEEMYLSSNAFESVYNNSGKSKFFGTDGTKFGYYFDVLGEGMTYEISVDDESLNSSIKSYASANGNWLHKLFNKELYVDAEEDYYPECKPIVEITESDLGQFLGMDITQKETVSKNLYVTVDDLENLNSFYSEYNSKNHVYLMRIDVNPYWAPEVTLSLGDNFYSTETGLFFEKAVYENFDILEFTFRNKEGEKKMIPVTCDPIDIVGSVVPGPGSTNDDFDVNDPSGKGKDTSMSWVDKLIDMFDSLTLAWKIFAIFIGLVLFGFLWKLFGGLISLVVGGLFKLVGAVGKGAVKTVTGVNAAVEHKADRHEEHRKTKRDEAREDRMEQEDLRRWKRKEQREDRMEQEDLRRQKRKEQRENRHDREEMKERKWRHDHESKKIDQSAREYVRKREKDHAEINLKVNEDIRRQENHDYIKGKREK